MERALQAVALLVLLTHSPAVLAEECTEARVVHAPCTGVLVPPAEARKALLCVRQDLPMLEAKIEANQRLCATSTNLLRAELDAERLRRIEIEERLLAVKPLVIKKEGPQIAPLVAGTSVGLLVGLLVGYYVSR